MKNIVKSAILMLIFVFCSGFITKEENIGYLLKKGEKLYKEKNYKEAENIYNEALKIDQGNEVINYNIGNVKYLEGRYDEAIDNYLKAGTDGKTMEKLGNAYVKSAENQQNQQEMIDRYQKALSVYKKGIIEDGNNKEIKYNYEYVSKKIKELQDKQQKKDDKNQKDNKEKKDNKDSKEQQNDKNQENKDKNNQKNENEQNKNGKDGKNGKNTQKDKQDDKEKKEQAQQSKAENGKDDKTKKEGQEVKKIDPKKLQEAQMILQAMEKSEKEELKNNIRIQNNGQESPEKHNW